MKLNNPTTAFYISIIIALILIFITASGKSEDFQENTTNIINGSYFMTITEKDGSDYAPYIGEYKLILSDDCNLTFICWYHGKRYDRKGTYAATKDQFVINCVGCHAPRAYQWQVKDDKLFLIKYKEVDPISVHTWKRIN